MTENTFPERAEPLGDYSILVDPVHRFGTDAFLLAGFASPRNRDRCIDLGTGCGIIPLLWLSEGRCVSVAGVDISSRACSLAERSASLNGVSGSFTVVNHDLRELAGSGLVREGYDLVVCNPPYFIENSGYTSPQPERAAARSEISCSFDDVCDAAVYLLRWGGRLCVCHRPERLADVIYSMRSHGIEPKRMRTVHNRASSEPWLLLVEGRRGGAGSMKIMPPFIMTDADGNTSAELEAVYSKYRKGRPGADGGESDKK